MIKLRKRGGKEGKKSLRMRKAFDRKWKEVFKRPFSTNRDVDREPNKIKNEIERYLVFAVSHVEEGRDGAHGAPPEDEGREAKVAVEELKGCCNVPPLFPPQSNIIA
jgi:hypothetical protein